MSKTSKKQSALETVKAEGERLDELTRRREAANRPKGYSEYLSQTLDDAKSALDAAKGTAELDRRRSAPGYGALGESLGRRGLGTSGYADYLTDAAEGRYRNARENAEQGYADAKRRAEADYEEYLEQHSAEEDESLRRAIRRMASDGIESYAEGYRYAVAEGLSGERAELFARMCDAYGSRDFRDGGTDTRIAILREIMQNGLDYESAYLYARAVGASGGIAKKIAEYAASVREDLGGLLGES